MMTLRRCAGLTPLMAALMKNRTAIIEIIVMLQPDFSAQDDQGRTALLFTVEVVPDLAGPTPLE